MTSKSRSYYAFIRTAKKKFGLTQGQAQSMYKSWAVKYSGLVRSSDIGRHPIVARRLAGESSIKTKSARARKTGGNTPRGGGDIRGGSRGEMLALVAPVKVNTISQWEEFYDTFLDDDIEMESSADYGDV